MLTLHSSSIRTRHKDARITVPPEMSEANRARLASLARICFGHYSPGPDYYTFTEVRGRKCWALFQAGFSAVPGAIKANKSCLVHPSRKAKFSMSDALAACKVAEAVGEAW